MKILIVSTYDLQGGAARAAYRLHKSLLSANINSEMLVQIKDSDDYTIKGPKSKKQKIIGKILLYLDRLFYKVKRINTRSFFSTGFSFSSQLNNAVKEVKPDILHLHWVTSGLLNLKDLEKIDVPIVWTLHDSWLFTGGCHIPGDCLLYQSSCGRCSVIGSDRENDLSRKIWGEKKSVFSVMRRLTIVGVSRWIMECSQKSSLLNAKKHFNLPNPIDINLYKPLEKSQQRKLFNLENDRLYILFGAMSATSDVNKGFTKLCEALALIKFDNLELVVFGSGKPQNSPKFKFDVHYLGNFKDDYSLVAIYNAVDVMVVPSIQENLSNTIMESLACGTPVVAFNIGGNSDLIDHKINGYLAEPYSPEDMARGIEWVLGHPNYDELSKNACKKVAEKFDSKKVAEQYIELYTKILEENVND